jgi:zinc protease
MSLKIEYEQYKLDNGLNVILHQDDKVPVVAVNVWYHVGSRNEKPGKTGYAHLFEHLMFEGSQHIPAGKHFEYIQRVGGILNGSTYFDRTNYFEVLPSHFLEMGLWLESDRMGWFLPDLDEKKLELQLGIVKNERRQTVDNQPYGVWLEKILEMVYPDDFPYHWPVIGFMDDLDRAKLHDFETFFKEYYGPQNASLVIAGDFDKRTAKENVEKYFAEIKNLAVLPQENVEFDSYNRGESRLILEDNVQFSRIYAAWPLPAFGEKEMYAADILSEVLSSGKSARLYRKLVHEKQICQDAMAALIPLEKSSLFVLLLTVKPGSSVEEVEKEAFKEIDRLINEKVSDYEFERVRNQLAVRKVAEIQTMMARANLLNQFYTSFNDASMINSEIDNYTNIDQLFLQNTAAKYLKEENRSVLIFNPVKQ